MCCNKPSSILCCHTSSSVTKCFLSFMAIMVWIYWLVSITSFIFLCIDSTEKDRSLITPAGNWVFNALIFHMTTYSMINLFENRRRLEDSFKLESQ